MMTEIANVEKETFWAHHTWLDTAKMPEKERVLVVVPVCGMADWGLGHPLDVEETVLLAVLRNAVELAKGEIALRVLPPLRFVLGPYDNCAFSLDPETAYAFVNEVVESVWKSGFRKIVFFNSSPWNEEIINKACARDLRIRLGVQPFSINLPGIGLDFHPTRSDSREALQTLATHLLGVAPRPDPAADPVPADRFAPGDAGSGPSLAGGATLEEAHAQGPAILQESVDRLVPLLREIDRRPNLPDDGEIPFKTEI